MHQHRDHTHHAVRTRNVGIPHRDAYRLPGRPRPAPAGAGSTAGVAAPEPSSVSAATSSAADSGPTANDTRPADLVDTLKAQLQIQQDTLAGLQQLSPPEEDRAEITARLLDPFRDAIGRQQALLPTIENVVASGDHVQLATMHTEYDAAGPSQVGRHLRP